MLEKRIQAAVKARDIVSPVRKIVDACLDAERRQLIEKSLFHGCRVGLPAFFPREEDHATVPVAMQPPHGRFHGRSLLRVDPQLRRQLQPPRNLKLPAPALHLRTQVRRHLFDLAQETQLAHAAEPALFFDR